MKVVQKSFTEPGNLLSVADTIKAIEESPNQKEAAKVYFFEVLMDKNKQTPEICAKIHRAIRTKWPKGLRRIKELAWAYGERKWQ